MTGHGPRLSAAVIARDEEAMIGDCLDSLAWADERLVLVDAATRDATRAVSRRHGARVEERPFDDFAAQRQAALGLAVGDWVLFVDADERVTAALRDEILATVRQPGDVAGFWIPRHNYLAGRLVRGGGWFPDEQLRLLKRGAARFDPMRLVHELALLDGPDGHLTQPLEHLSHPSLAAFVRKQEQYCCLDARRWLATFGPPRRRALVGQPARVLWHRYVRLHGYREGLLGLQLSVVLAWYAGKSVWLARRLSRRPAPPAGARPPW